MKEFDLKKYITSPSLVEKVIKDFIIKEQIIIQKLDVRELNGHLYKAEHNLNFIKDISNLGYYDWALTGCYYAAYYSALALIQTKGFSSKNHLATLLILIKEFYTKELNKEDIEIFEKLLDYQDILFYVQSKNIREDASYSTQTKFDKKLVEKLRIQTTLFVSKINNIIKNINTFQQPK